MRCLRTAYIRLLTTQTIFLAPWKAHYLSQQRFEENPNDPQPFVYGGLIDLAIQASEGATFSPDFEAILT